MKAAKIYSLLLFTAFMAILSSSCQKRGCCGHHHGNCKNHTANQLGSTTPAK